MTDKDVAASCCEKVRAAARAYGSQKKLAIELEIDEPTLSRALGAELEKVVRVLSALGMEIVPREERGAYRTLIRGLLDEVSATDKR